MFIKDLHVHSQSVRGIHYSTKFAEDLDFNQTDENDYHINYDVLTHKQNRRDHLVILKFGINGLDDRAEENKDHPVKNEFQVVVEGHYEVADHVAEENIYDAIHYAALSNLLAFLRTSVHAITSFTRNGPCYLPLIELDELHKQFRKRSKPKENKQEN